MLKDNDSRKRWQYNQWAFELGFAIAQIEPEQVGIKLLFHELARVRQGAWLAIGKVGQVEIVKKLIEKHRNSKPYQAHFRHAAYRAIDESLITIEVKGGEKELKGLKELCPTVTDKEIVCPTVKHASIKDRLHWTILSLEQRVDEDMNKVQVLD